MARRKTNEEFIKDAQKIHGDKYDYSEVEYINNKKHVKIICKIHGEFYIQPNFHLCGGGCSKCYGNDRKNTDKFIEDAQKIHGDKYDYSEVEYVNNKTKVCIICPEHGEFYQTPHLHLSGGGCRKCKYENDKDKKRKKLDVFINQANYIHSYKYDYSKVNYINSKTLISIICPKHGEFQQIPSTHINGSGCPHCSNSKLENKIRKILEEYNINFVKEKKFDWLIYKGNMRLDFFLIDYNVAIECQGSQHFYPHEYFGGEFGFRIRLYRDLLKKKLCDEHNIEIIYFNYNDDINDFKSRLINLLNL